MKKGKSLKRKHAELEKPKDEIKLPPQTRKSDEPTPKKVGL